MLREPYCLETQRNGMADDIFEIIARVAGTELSRVGMHSEGHFHRVRCE